MNAVVQPIIQPDPALMLEHVDHLFGGFLDGYQDGLVELAWTNTKPNPKTGKYDLAHGRLFGTDKLDELVTEAVRLNSQPMCNVYIGAWLRKPDTAPFGRTVDADAWAMTAAYSDLDDAGATARAKDVYGELKPTWITMTGMLPHSRAQTWWRLEEPITDHARGEALIRGITTAMAGDESICNPGRVMRLAGSLAWATKEGRQLELTFRAPLKNPGQPIYVAEQLERKFPPIAGKPSGVDTGAATHLTAGIVGKINDGRERYMRDTVLAVLGEYIGQNGCAPTAQELFDIAWPQYEDKTDFTRAGRGKEELAEKCQYTLKRFEAGKIRGLETLDKAIEHYAKKQLARAQAGIEPKLLKVDRPAGEGIKATAFQWVDAESIPPREWIYGRHYIRKFVSSTVAPGGIGKSSLGIAETLAICTGMPLLGVVVDERTNVWLWNGEDPHDELERRIMATALHYKLTPKDIAGRLFVDNGRQTPIIIAERTRDGVVINAPLVDQVIQAIRDNNIGLMIIDPFIACHRVTENDNNEIDRVAKIWAAIADVTSCSIELVHHVRKATGNEIQVEDGRGAGALLAAARAARALNRMTEEEGAKAGVVDHRFYFRADDGKANLAPPSANAKWFQLLSYDLGNATKDRPSDKIGVVASWGWPDHSDGVTASDMQAVRQKVSTGKWRADSQATDWVGYAIIEVLGVDTTEATKAKAKSLQAMWVKSGALKEVIENDAKRNPRKYVRPGAFNE
jgi:RecA-family ATPase